MATKFKKDVPTFLLLCVTFLMMTSCGKGNDSSSHLGQQLEEERKFQQKGDVYRAVLTPINTQLSGSPSGIVEAIIVGQEITFESALTNTPGGVKHLQAIHESGTCPDLTNDLNQDGVIDIEEAQSQIGKILIPLDNDLNSQNEGISYGPVANEWGTYVYKRSATLDRLMSDLYSTEVPMHNYLSKLPFKDALNLEKRTVVIYGVVDSEVSNSLISFNGNTPEESLPIACGLFVKRKKTEL